MPAAGGRRASRGAATRRRTVLALLSLAAPGEASLPSTVDCVAGLWAAPPTNAPTTSNAVTNGAYSGNVRARCAALWPRVTYSTHLHPRQLTRRSLAPSQGDLGVVVGAAPVAPTSLAFYMDLMQWRCPSSTGKAKCGYGSGGHAGVGWLGVQVGAAAGSQQSFAMQQAVRRAEVTSQSTFSSGAVLHSRLKVHASENLAVVELWFNRSASVSAADAPATLSLEVSDEVYNSDTKAETQIMACRTNCAGQDSDYHNATAATPPWQWVESWLGRGYQDHRAFPAAHHDVLPLTSRVEHVAMATAFGGQFVHRTNASSNFDGHLGYRSSSTVEISEGQVLRLSTQLWTERDFAFKRNPKAAVAQSMGSVEDPVRTTT